jgi:hypothetical protein
MDKKVLKHFMIFNFLSSTEMDLQSDFNDLRVEDKPCSIFHGGG